MDELNDDLRIILVLRATSSRRPCISCICMVHTIAEVVTGDGDRWAYGPCWWREKNEKKKKWGRAAAPKQFVWEKEGKSKKQGEAQRRPEPARYDSLSSIVFHHDHDPTSA